MRKLTIKAYSFDEAKQKALEEGITVVRNVTPSFKKENPVDFDVFAQQMLEKNKLTNATGVGCIVVSEAGSADTRERPYEFINNVTEGQLTKKRVFEIRTASDDTFVAEAETKVEAARLAKVAMKTTKQDLICKQVYRVDDDHALAFSLKYVPSSNTKLGTYIVFGN
ncbi:MAG: hypothetical protein PUJ51_23540 [Clostridiales bacterium]|nr:hypothetical protein [Clostridiales bacterium]MDY4136570.1 hypothetical protein [Terrisporobacter sp.]